MLFGQCPHGGGDKLKGASLTQCAMHTLQIMFNGVKDIKHKSGVDGI